MVLLFAHRCQLSITMVGGARGLAKAASECEILFEGRQKRPQGISGKLGRSSGKGECNDSRRHL